MKLLNVIPIWWCLCVVHSAPGSFYYSAPLPYYQQFPTASYHGHQAFQPYTVAAAPTYNLWQPQTYYNPPVVRYQQPTYTPQESQRKMPVNTPARTRYTGEPSDNYRGFAYHTRYDGGASAHVVFLTGPEARQLQINMPKLESRMTITAKPKQISGVEIAKTAASDAVDKIANKNFIFPELPRNSAFDALRTFLENDDEGIQNYYSNNGILEARRNFGDLPASTAILRTPVNNISSRSGDIDIIETVTRKEEKSQEEEVAESINTNTRFMPNIIVVEDEDDSKIKEIIPSSSTSTTTTTTATSTSAESITVAPLSNVTTTESTTTATGATISTTAAPTTDSFPRTSSMQPIIVEDMAIIAESRSITTEAGSTTTDYSTSESMELTTSSIETTTQ